MDRFCGVLSMKLRSFSAFDNTSSKKMNRMVPCSGCVADCDNKQPFETKSRTEKKADSKVLGAPVVVGRSKASVWPLRPIYE